MANKEKGHKFVDKTYNVFVRVWV